MRRQLKRYGLIIIMTLVMCEGLARLMIAAPPARADYVETQIKRGETLFAANTFYVNDIRGLYADAGDVVLNISGRRLIMPDTPADGRAQILFLGGSTTEARFVPEADRFVALLNSPQQATYNAAVSGNNILSMLLNFDYLTARGLAPDVVVLSTMHNDWVIQRRFESVGYTFRPENYIAGQEAYQWANTADYPSPVQQLETTVRLTGLFARLFAPSNPVLEYYRSSVQDAAPQPATLASCDMDNWMREYQATETANMAALKRHVEAVGARLVIMSEATSYGAPSSSFTEDLRVPVQCGGGSLNAVDAVVWYQHLDAAYLDAARANGLAVIDLATLMGVYTNGPLGGVYQYDSMHYTLTGSRKVAELIRPYLED
jgi:hypothetical protein